MHHLASIPLAQPRLLPPLIQDYIEGKKEISFLHKYPFEFGAFKKVISDKTKDNTDRKLLVGVLQAQYNFIPVSESVSRNIQLLDSENTFTVTAAHQPCLFMGPLYNIYKISCTINICYQLKSEFPNYNFVPIFWLGSEDHDVEELNHAYISGKRIEWQNPGTGASGRWESASMQSAIAELESMLPDSEIVSILRDGLNRYPSFGQFTQYFVNQVFGEHGLVVIDADNVHLKRKLAHLVKDEILNSTAVEVLKTTIEFLETSYKAQTKPRDINFFYLHGNRRERILYDSELQRFKVNNTSFSLSRDEMISEIETHPECFSPNVIYRPLYQEMLLPNLAFIGGAGELSYWLELKPLFDHYKVNYPMQVIRNSAAIISASVKKKMEKLNLKAEDFFGDVEQLINRYVQQNMNGSSNLNDEKRSVEELFQSILSKAEAADTTLKSNALAEKHKVITALENLEAKMLKAEKRKQESVVSQIRSIHAVFFPENILQERKENFIPYYDKDFITLLVQALNPFSESFRIFTE